MMTDIFQVTVAGHSAGAAITGLTHLWPDHDLYRSSVGQQVFVL